MTPKWILLFLFIFIFSACTSQESSESSAEPPAPNQAIQSDISLTSEESAPVGDILRQESPQPTERVILKNATLRLVVENPSERASEISTEAEQLGGWVVSLNTTQFTNNAGDTDTRADITVRVPAETLTQTLESFKTNAVQVLGETLSGEDVTAEYVDLQSRLTNLQTAETQYQSFMADAQNITEVTTVYNELIRVRGEIEVIEGRIRYFDESAAFSSVRIELYPPEAEVTLASTDSSWQPGDAVEDAWNTLGSALEGLGTLVIWLLVFALPMLLVLAIPLGAVYYLYRRYQTAFRPKG